MPTASAMNQNNIHILSTRPLGDEQVKDARDLCILIDVLSFIDTEPILSVEVQQEIEQALLLSTVVVFTSMNAVEAVATFIMDEQPDWQIYCMGKTTRDLVKKYFGEESIAGTASSATELAESIIEDSITAEVIFFCGDKRRDELPTQLMAHDIDVNEIVVYHTILTAHKVDRKYHGILFFSPSAVESFFSKNKITGDTIFFAIGKTTAATIKKHSGNTIIISDEPGKENLMEKVFNYFVNNER